MESIIHNGGGCYICGARAEEIHHCLHGSRRKKAEEYGLTVNLCRECHRRLHDKGEHDRELQEIAERAFLTTYGPRLAFDVWMKEFGKNYLDGIE